MAILQKKKVKGIEYYYLVESKRINGKPTPVVIEYIGNQKKLEEKLLHPTSKNLTLKSYSYGDTYALMKIVSKVGAEEILDKLLKPKISNGVKRSTSIILAAMQRVCRPGSKNAFEEWFKTTSLPHELNIKPEIMTSQHFWEQMDDITEEELMKAEDSITKKLLEIYNIELDKLALDYTNYFTYIATDNKRCKLPKRGHNKQKRNDLRQLSLAIVTSRDLGIPLFSHVYEGNRNDKAEFHEYILKLKKRIPKYNPEKLTVVFDTGSTTKENLESVEMHYICGFSLNYYKKLYDINIEDYDEIKINGNIKKHYRTTENIWNKKRTCILIFSESLYNGQLRELEVNISKCIKELEKLKEQLKNPKTRIDKTKKGLQGKLDKILKSKYASDIIDVIVTKDSIDYEINCKKKEEIAHKYFGKSLLITDRAKWETWRIIQAYYQQDNIEKLFRDSKDTDHFSLQPIYHWTDQKIRVHIFISLLGLTLATILQKEVEDAGIHISKDKLLDALFQVRESWVKHSDNNIVKTLEEMDGEQSKIWNVVNKL